MVRHAPPADSETVAAAGRTRARLLEAAGASFAEHGFRAATVRDICERAGANVAAIHYHFGDKAGLYAEVLRAAHDRALQRYPATDPAGRAAPPGQRLAVFVSSFLRRIFDPGQPAWFGRLIAREMIEPTPALDALVASNIRPQCALLMDIVRELLGPRGADDQLVRWCTASIVGQCVFYHHCRPVIARLFPEQRYQPDDIERLAAHIAGFSLRALAELRTGSAPPAAPADARRTRPAVLAPPAKAAARRPARKPARKGGPR